MNHLLVVCTGNICRSPLAEAWFRQQLPGLHIESAGTDALVGKPAEADAIEVGRKHGLDLTAHLARQLESSMLKRADLVLVMEEAQAKSIRQNFPWTTGKVWRLGENRSEDVPDPYKRGLEWFDEAFNLIAQLGQNWIPLLRAK